MEWISVSAVPCSVYMGGYGTVQALPLEKNGHRARRRASLKATAF